MRPIDADELKDRFAKKSQDFESCSDYLIAIELVAACHEIKTAPVSKSKRCKNCINFDTHIFEDGWSTTMCWRYDFHMKENDFCSYFEERI